MPGLVAADGNINQICIPKTINRTAPFNLRDLILLSSLSVLSVDTREPWHVIDTQTRHNLPIPSTVIPAQYLLKKETLLFFQFCSFITMCTASRYNTIFPLPALSTECSGCHAHKMWEGADNCVSGLHYLLVLAPRRYRYIYTSPLLPACFLRRDLVPSPRPRYCDTSPRPVLPVLCTFTLNLYI